MSEFDLGCADAIVAGYLVTGCGNCCIFEGQLYYMIACCSCCFTVVSWCRRSWRLFTSWSWLKLQLLPSVCRSQNSPACLSAGERRRNKRMQQANATSECNKRTQQKIVNASRHRNKRTIWRSWCTAGSCLKTVDTVGFLVCETPTTQWRSRIF